MKKILLVAAFAISCSMSFSQTLYFTRSGQISFFSKTSLENIDAINNEVTSMLETQKGDVVFAVLIKSFKFERALMEEHFNENYMESDKLPKSNFSGKITNLSSINFKKNGSYPADVEGDLTIHGVTKKVKTSGTIDVAGTNLTVKCKFNAKPADYDIKVPSLVAEKIAESIEIIVNCQYTPKQ